MTASTAHAQGGLNLTFGDCAGSTHAYLDLHHEQRRHVHGGLLGGVPGRPHAPWSPRKASSKSTFPTAVPDWWKARYRLLPRLERRRRRLLRSARSRASTTSAASVPSWAATPTRSVRTPPSATRTARSTRTASASAPSRRWTSRPRRLATPPAGWRRDLPVHDLAATSPRRWARARAAGCTSPAAIALQAGQAEPARRHRRSCDLQPAHVLLWPGPGRDSRSLPDGRDGPQQLGAVEVAVPVARFESPRGGRLPGRLARLLARDRTSQIPRSGRRSMADP